jgi:hypothetical protein
MISLFKSLTKLVFKPYYSLLMRPITRYRTTRQPNLLLIIRMYLKLGVYSSCEVESRDLDWEL